MAAKKIDLFEVLNQVHNFDVNLLTREIYLHSHPNAWMSDEEGGIEYRMATQFVKNLHLLNYADQTNILVHMQSPGGEWGHGIAIYDAIMHSKAPVTILAHGEVQSMSSVVFQAAKRRILMPNCSLMIHRGFLSIDGTTNVANSHVAWNLKTDEMMLNIFANRAAACPFFIDKNHSQIIEFIDDKLRRLGDWNMDAENAIYYGFADGIYGRKGFETVDKIRKV
jgi:ATP-dependent protease ClpP protease subunit